jgi:hypothetical protein
VCKAHLQYDGDLKCDWFQQFRKMKRMTPWVLIAADFEYYGGMDRASVALSKYLSSIGT